LNLRARGPCFALPVRARRAKARKRLPSSREPASVNPQAMQKGNLLGTLLHAHRFAFCPSAPRVSWPRATDFFLASALSSSPTGLATSRWRRRAMRPTDVCHPNDCCVHPHLARSRLALATFAAGSPHGVLGSAWHFRGPGRFTTSVVASADRSTLAYLELYCLTAWRHERGRFLPTAMLRSSL
jgi:hypothetical protein